MIPLNRGRDADQNKRSFAALGDALRFRAGLRREDGVASRVGVGREDRAFGNGEAQRA